MDKFLETYTLLKLNQKQREKLNTQIPPSETEAITMKLPPNKSPAPDGFTGEFYQKF